MKIIDKVGIVQYYSFIWYTENVVRNLIKGTVSVLNKGNNARDGSLI